jgi:hypothetical protein
MVRGEFNICGPRNKTLQRHLPDKNSGQVSRLLPDAGLKLRELVVIPQLAFGHVG